VPVCLKERRALCHDERGVGGQAQNVHQTVLKVKLNDALNTSLQFKGENITDENHFSMLN
jgi:hypothetical protein